MSVRSSKGRPAIYPQTRRALFEHVDQLREAGERQLPSETQLCEKFRVSRPLIRRALGELKARGQVASVPGKGYFLENPDGSAATAGGTISVVLGSLAQWDQYVNGIMRGLESVFADQSYRLAAERLGSPDRDVAELIRPYLADLCGAVVVPLADQSVRMLRRPLPDHLPCVVAGRPSGDPQLPCVYVNHERGARQATDLLLDLGHTAIGHVRRFPLGWPTAGRHRGYLQAMHDRGLEPNPDLTVDPNIEDHEHAEQILERFLHTARCAGCTALLVERNFLSMLLKQVRRMGLRIPDDLSIIGFDDSTAARDHLPAISVVEQPCERMGRLAGQMLADALAGNTPDPGEVVLSPELRVRPSTAAPPTSNHRRRGAGDIR